MSEGSTSTLQRESTTLPKAGFVLLVMLTFLWGGNWPMMKLALGEIPPWTFRTICVYGGGLGILLIARLSGGSIAVPASDRLKLALCAVLNITGWQLFTAYGISLMNASHATVIAFTMPLWASLLAVPVLGERLTPLKLLGLVLGLAGLGVLLWEDISVLGQAPVGALFMLGAAICWGTGTVLVKRFDWRISTATLTGWQLIAGGLPIVLGAALIEGDPRHSLDVSTAALIALAYIVLIPMIFCHWAWYTVVRLFPAAVAAIGTLAIPVVGVLTSAIILGEPLGVREIGALLLVCSALAVVLVFPGLRRGLRA